MKWGCSPGFCSAPTAAMCCISSGIRTKTANRTCYICGSYKKRTRNCTAHFIRTDLLTAGVLANLRQVTEYAAKHESRFVKLLVQQNEIGGKRKTAAAIKQLEQAQETHF